MININLEVSQKAAAKFKGDLAMFEEYLGHLGGELMKQESALTALAAIMFQAPLPNEGGKIKEDVGLGLGLFAKRQGERAVAFDISKIFRTNDDTLPNVLAFAGSLENFMAWKSQPFPKKLRSPITQKIWADENMERAYDRVRRYIGRKADENAALVQRKTYAEYGEMKSIHEGQKKIYRGRLYAHGGPSRDIKLSPYIVSEQNLRRYTKERQKRVGWMKAGWATVIARIGRVNINGRTFNPAGGKVPAWVKRHGQGGGGAVNISYTRERKKAVILNSAGNVDGIAISWDVAKKVIDFRNFSLNARPYQSDVDKAVSLWNSGRIKVRGY